MILLGYHGVSGPMKIADLEKTPLVDAFLDAGRELGYGVTDVNGPNQLGMYAMKHSVFDNH